MTPEERAKRAALAIIDFVPVRTAVGCDPFHPDQIAAIIAAAVREAEEAVRRKGYGPGFSHMVEGARPVARVIVEEVRANTPDRTGIGLETIIANAIAMFAATEVEGERERCLRIASDIVDMDDREELANAIREGQS